MYLAYNTAAIEKLGKPVVMMFNRTFVNDVSTGISMKGLPTMRLVPASLSTGISVGTPRGDEVIREGVSALLDDLIVAMTKPVTAGEKSPKPKEVPSTKGVVFKGSLQDVNQFFYKRGWSPGIPIIPPTEEEVATMLTGTDLPPDHVVAKLPPRYGKATVEKIAINAVMAGCLPTYMPVLIAATQVLADPGILLEGYACSIASWAAFWIINGPIRNDINVNSGLNLVSHEYLPNATIGRAMAYIIKNIAGTRPGMEDMAYWGHEGKYGMCIAENEEHSPWEPLHVEQGFKKEDSCVTAHFPHSRIYLSNADDVPHRLHLICNNVTNTVGVGGMTLLFSPRTAERFAQEGWTKQQIVAYVTEYATRPAYGHRHGESIPPKGQREGTMVRTDFGEVPGTWKQQARMFAPLNPMQPMRLFRSPDCIKVVVAGGTLTQPTAMAYLGGGDYGGFVTKKIELPRNWKALVKKYKDLVPTFAPY